MKHKNSCIDKIINKLISKQNEIKKIGFLNCEKNIKKLLWFLIYSFTDMVSNHLCHEKFKYNYSNLNRSDGGCYNPIGEFVSESDILLDPIYTEKYKGLETWNCYGTYTLTDGDNFLSCFGLHKKTDSESHNSLNFKPLTPDVFIYREILFKVLKNDFKIEDMSDDENYQLSRLIELGYLSASSENGKIEPNFCVFTPNRKKALDSILREIFNELEPNLQRLFNDIYQVCKANLPKQLDNLLGYVTHYNLTQCNFITTGIAFYDNLIYIPNSDNERSILSTCMAIGEKEINKNKRYSFSLNLIKE